jgi:hypothetical protein
MARRFTLVEETESTLATLPDGFMPGTVAPFVMRYGVDFLVAMQRSAAAQENAPASEQAEPA